MTPTDTPQEFGTLPDGKTVKAIRLRGGGLSATLLTFGARVQDLRLDGADHPLVLGADTLEPYLDPMIYHGAIVGRFANRIADGRFTLDGETYRTDPNEGKRQTLHGGADGTAAHLWEIREVSADSATLSLTLPDGHMGFPGALTILATHSLPGDGTLAIEITATTDVPTPCSLAHHGYFTLADGRPVSEQELWIDADRYLPVDDRLIPVPEAPAPVADTRFDFRTPRRIGTDGIDHNFCLNETPGDMRKVVRVTADNGLSLEVETDQPGLQVYDANSQPKLTGLGGRAYGAFAGLALETQAWPDAVNRPNFPDAILRPGETYRHRVHYRFARD
ncbi:aldose epimerase family protein [Thalassococcus sp. BH17M4-6]|uniref:aldose epimerase family protein n=1 Tax=Thalassococcus sp. BH17M4-6 TaxID=3413148 RepID=UPI003BCC434C